MVTENRGGEYTVRVIYPQRQEVKVRFWDLFSDFELPRVEVRVALEIPDGLPVSLKSTSGDLTTTGVRSRQVARVDERRRFGVRRQRRASDTTSGDVRLVDSGPRAFTP